MRGVNINKKYFEYLFIILLTSYLYLSKIDEIKFHIDEGTWIPTSTYFDALIKGNINSPIWDPGYWTLTQPPVTRYIIGISRKLNNSGPELVNKPWDYSADDETNIKKGAMPSPELLRIARIPMVMMAILSIFLVFYCTRKYVGILASYILFILLVSNTYLDIQLSRAMSESPLLLFIILTAILLFIAARLCINSNKIIFKSKIKFTVWILILFIIGIFMGITGGIKLNGFALLGVGISLFALLLFASNHLNNISKKARILMLSGIISILTFSCLFTFVAMNPFLYKNTINRTVALFKWRLHEMNNQTKHSSNDLTKLSLTNRVLKVGNNILNKYASISFRGASILNLLLCLTGFIIVVRKSIVFLKEINPIYSIYCYYLVAL